MREQASKLYKPIAYFTAKNRLETLAGLITPMIQMLIVYWGVGYDEAAGADAGTFFLIYLVLALVALSAMAIGMLISALAPNVQTAVALAPALTLPIMLFGGFIVNT